MTRLGLLVGDACPELTTLVAALARTVHVTDGERDDCDAWLCAAGDPLRPPAGSRCAVWVGTGEAVPDDLPARVHCGPGPAPAGSTAWVRVGNLAGVPGARPLAPFTRSRVRRARGLPDAVAVQVGESWLWNGVPVGSALTPTVLATASAVASQGAIVLEALAWAAPVVTDPATAAWLKLGAGTEVLVGRDAAERTALAGALAADERRAAALSTRGHAAWSSRTVERAADLILERLAPGPPPDRLQHVLSVLGTPSTSPVRARAARAGALLSSGAR